jgi:hypothetical protein
MPIPFPAVEPTAFAFVMPRHPVTSAVSESGVQDHRLWGTVAVDGALELEFRNIKTEVATSILQTFHTSYSGLLPLDLPDILFAGETAADRAFIDSVTTEAGLQWFWPVGQNAPNPRKSLTYKNRCTLLVRLEARLENTPQPLPPAPILWSSRLTTATRSPWANGGAQGSIVAGLNGASFQAFWFEDPSTSGVRVAVVKRDAMGFILWQRWTAAEFGTGVTSRDATAPQVVPMADGGCVVLAGSTSDTSPAPADFIWMRAWRLSGDNSQTWAMQYTGQLRRGPAKAVINGSELVVLTSAHAGSNNIRPMLLRLNLSNGAVLGASAYQFDNTSGFPGVNGAFDNVFSLSSGSLSFTIGRQIFVEVSSDTSFVTRSVIFNSYSDASAIPGGGYLARNSDAQLMRLDSSFNITDRYKHDNAMQTSGKFWGFETYALGVAADGSGYAISNSFASGSFLGGTTFKIAKFSSFGGSVTGYNEVDYGSSIGNPSQSMDHDLDIASGRGLVHIFNGTLSDCRLTAIGFALDQPTSTASNTIPAATLATGSCNNTMRVRGWDAVTYSTVTPDTIDRTTVSTTVTAITITGVAGAISMTDASNSLSWQRTALDA